MITDSLGTQIKVGSVVLYPDKYTLQVGKVVRISKSTFVKVQPQGSEMLELPYYPENLVW